MNWNIFTTIDLDRGGEPVRYREGVLAEVGDKNSHRWDVAVTKNYTPFSLAGATVTGYFLRPDNIMAVVPGTASGNVATVILKEECFAVAGGMTCVLKATLDGATLTLDAFKLHVRGDFSDTIVDPDDIIPSLQELMAQIDRMEAATEAAEEAAASVVIYHCTDDGEGNITVTTSGGAS